MSTWVQYITTSSTFDIWEYNIFLIEIQQFIELINQKMNTESKICIHDYRNSETITSLDGGSMGERVGGF